MAKRYRYRVVERERDTLLLRDDGYRIHVMVLNDDVTTPKENEWVLWAEYKQCDFPGIGSAVADLLMSPATG